MSDAQRSPVWALHDGAAGNVRQATALARALGWPAAFSPVLVPAAPWRWLAPRRLPGDSQAFGPAFAQALLQPPRVAIGCGRQAALATRLARSRGAATVQILDPRMDRRHWDLVVLPEHDHVRGSNVLTLLGSLHPIDDDWLAAARATFAEFAAQSAPRVALLVGGPTARVPWTLPQLQAQVEALLEQLRGHGSVLATVSRRTPAPATAWLRERLREVPGVLWTGEADGPNPYAGLLGWAQAIACTADSSNLLSEACATRVPVTAWFADQARSRAAGLVAGLRARGRLADPLSLAIDAQVEPVRETARIAAEVRERIQVPLPLTAD